MKDNSITIRLTVLMVVYNEPLPFVRIQIESILKQTYNNYIFIIVSDNPSNTELNNLTKEFERQDERIRIIINENNLGIPKAKNVGLSIATTEYIAISDADDFSHPERFERQIGYLDTHPEVVAVGSYALIMNEKGRVINEMHTSNDDKLMKSMLPFEQPLYHPSMIYRRVINGKPIRYNESMKISLDYELCNQMSSGVYANIPEYLLYYRFSQNQTTKIYKDKYIEYDAPIRKKALRKYYNDITDKDADAFINMYYRLKVDNESLDDVDTFLLHLYQNKNTYKREMNHVMTFLMVRYVEFLMQNETKTNVIKRFVRLNKNLGDSFYLRVFGYGIGKISNKIKYRLINKKCPAYK